MNYQLISRKLQLSSTPAGIFSALFAASPYAFWLDSSRHDTERARLSFLGACDGPHSYRIDNFVGGSTTLTRANGETEIIESDIFLLLEKCLGSITVESDRSLPFDFQGGFVGYFGYELMAITEQVSGHASPMPDAILLFIDRFIAVDHRTNELYLAALHCGTAFSVETWLTYVEGVLDTLPVSGEKPRMNPRLLASCDVEPFLLHDRDTYLRQIVLAKQKIVEGESYEICLTNRVRVLSR